ncbi:hypothetical protein E2R51_05875 [Jeotgalibacillus sp. S-D1]|uniref:YueH family protein n=1 Tax=Jeotgalibacillus sp. S-D1 TaxID=2552189 RepID=UPI00105A5C49|nr:YueH family protein [Jeotgalibacillus sp. S-D1]TDL35247.1 hypothetical protein E2R51_05875 [Jeotgalibacillus sp. S-D1]
MKIRKIISSGKERKIFIHENKKEEMILVAIPSLHWSIEFSYDELGEKMVQTITSSLSGQTDSSTAAELANRISQWTREM